MVKPGAKENKPAELKRITDYVNVGAGERLEGDKVDIDDILGQDIVLTDFNFVQSSKYADEKSGKSGEFAILQFNRIGDKKKLTTACGGKVVMRALKEMPKSYLPVTIKITRRKSDTGTGKYYAIE